MSGVAKDDPTSDTASEKTVSAVGDAEAGHAEAPAGASADVDGKGGRKNAPFLRVVTGDAASDFVSELPAQEPALTPDVLPNQRIGSAIRSRRESLGYSLDQVAKDTRVHLSHLRAIEEMTPNLLGAPVYAKGYIRAYARYLGLDEMSTLDRYLRECAILKDPEKQEIAPPTTGRQLPATVPVLGFLVVALLGGAAAAFFMNGNGGAKTTAAATNTQATATTGGSAAVVATDPIPAQQLRILAVRRSMLEVRSADGTKFVHRYFEAGESYTVRQGAGWTVSALEDGSAFEWRLGDKSLGLLSDVAAPINAQSADLAATRTPIADPAAAQPNMTDGERLNAAGGAPAATPATGAAPAAGAPAVAGAAPAPVKPKPVAKPKPATPAATSEPEAAPPVAAAPKPAQPATPAQDPALAAYPNQAAPQ